MFIMTSLERLKLVLPYRRYKGMKHATMIKYKIGEKAPRVLDSDQLKNEPLPEPEEPYYSAKNREQMKQKRSGESGVKSSATVPNPNIENVIACSSKDYVQDSTFQI